jgi:hypothetical protein
MENYVGRKCKGFRFESGTDGVKWLEEKKNQIGEVGLIVKQIDGYVVIEFKDYSWSYPISLIEPYLIPESPQIPKLGEGVEMEVSHSSIIWSKRKVIAQTKNGFYLSEPFASYKYLRPIQEVKKYTKEELVKILGHDFEII